MACLLLYYLAERTRRIRHGGQEREKQGLNLNNGTKQAWVRQTGRVSIQRVKKPKDRGAKMGKGTAEAIEKENEIEKRKVQIVILQEA